MYISLEPEGFDEFCSYFLATELMWSFRWTSHSLTDLSPSRRSRQLCGYSGISKNIIEPEVSLPCSQEPSTGPYHEPHLSNPYHPILSKIHFNIIHPPTSWSRQLSLLGFQPFLLSPMRSTCPAHPSCTEYYLSEMHFNIVHPPTSWSSSGLFWLFRHSYCRTCVLHALLISSFLHPVLSL
jgi:hypothetical protein